jgi:hypothetical protein
LHSLQPAYGHHADGGEYAMTEKTNTASAPAAQDVDELIEFLDGFVGGLVKTPELHPVRRHSTKALATAFAIKARIEELEKINELCLNRIAFLIDKFDKIRKTMSNLDAGVNE